MSSQSFLQNLVGLGPPAHGGQQIGTHSKKEDLEVFRKPIIVGNLVEGVESFWESTLVREDHHELDRQVNCVREKLPPHPQELLGTFRVTESFERDGHQVAGVW
jgi:hypothetical protein